MLRINPFLVCLFVLIALTACKKDSTPNIPPPDDISYQEINPIAEMTTATGYYWGAPIPSDSITMDSLDINNDSITDFNITMRHWYHWYTNGAGNPHTANSVNYSYSMSITSSNSNAEVALSSPQAYFNGRLFEEDDEIKWNTSDNPIVWSSGASLFRTGGAFAAGQGSYGFSGTKFLGVRLKNGSGYNYGWLKINKSSTEFKLQLLSFGFNHTINNPILAGQQE